MEWEFETEAKVLVARVHAGEPGCKLYTLAAARRPTPTSCWKRYVDQAAIDFHRSTGHYKEVGAQDRKYADGPVEVRFMTEV